MSALPLVVVLPPSPHGKDEIAFQRLLLRKCYVETERQKQAETEDEEAKRAKAMEERQKIADDFLAFFPFPWTEGLRTVGSKEDRDSLVKKAQEQVRKLLGKAMTEPAANKWTKMDQVIRPVILKAWFGNWFRRGVGKKLGRKDDDKSGLAVGTNDLDLDLDRAIGVPTDMGQERKVGHIKLNKVYRFLGHGEAKYLFLVWLCIALQVMPVHYALFRTGTWFNRRREAGQEKISDFLDGSTGSPVRSCLGALAEMLLDSRGSGQRHSGRSDGPLASACAPGPPCGSHGGFLHTVARAHCLLRLLPVVVGRPFQQRQSHGGAPGSMGGTFWATCRIAV